MLFRSTETVVTQSGKSFVVPVSERDKLIVAEWINREREHGLELSGVRPRWARAGIYYMLAAAILLFSSESENFIYFQF